MEAKCNKALEQEVLDSISIEGLWPSLEVIYKDTKNSGSPEEFEAVRFIQSKLNEYGVQNSLYEYKGYLSYPISGKVEVVSDGNRTLMAKTRAFSANTPAEGIKGEIVYIPGGKDLFTDKETMKILEATDLTGKIVLTEGGGRQNMIFAQQKGAIGYIHMWPSAEDVIHEGIVTSVWGTPTPEKLDVLLKIPVVSIKNLDGVELAKALKKDKVTVRMYTVTDTKWRDQKLLEAVIPGKTDEFVLIGGHIDSWHKGATDNVTGNATCLELARVLGGVSGKLERGVRICWWPGHSTGRYGGSTWYCDNKWMDLHNDCVAYINIDSPGPLGACDYSEVTAVAETVNFESKIIEDVIGVTPTCERPVRAGDQSFWGPGITSLYMLLSNLPKEQRARVGGSGYGWWWHTEEDTIDKIGKKELLADIKIYALSALRLCTAKLLPYDIASVSRELCGFVSEYDKKGGNLFDLSPVYGALDRLDAAIAAFGKKTAGLGGNTDFEPYNRAFSAALRSLTTINYTYVGEFEHDPAVPSTPLSLLFDVTKLPALKGSEMIGFTLTKLKRNCNNVVCHIEKAAGLLESVI